MAAAAPKKSLFKILKSYIKYPWEITGPCSHPEYRSALPKATEYRINCPATPGGAARAIIPTANPEHVYGINYHPRDQKRNRPLIRRYIMKKAVVEIMMKEAKFDVKDFPQVYLVDAVEEDLDAIGGGYQK